MFSDPRNEPPNLARALFYKPHEQTKLTAIHMQTTHFTSGAPQCCFNACISLLKMSKTSKPISFT